MRIPIEMKAAAMTAVITEAVKMPFGSLKKTTTLCQPKIAASGWKNSLLRMFA